MTYRILRFGPPILAGLMVAIAVHAAHAEDSVDGLLRNYKRLDEVQAGCKVNAPWATDALCKTAAEAIRRRFRGEGVPYTPQHVDPFPSQPDPKPAHPPTTKPEAHHRPTAPRPNAIF